MYLDSTIVFVYRKAKGGAISNDLALTTWQQEVRDVTDDTTDKVGSMHHLCIHIKEKPGVLL